ncbi:uncharacterized protein METZ01_LOCUS429269, partial [marine metagenome]
MVDLEKWDLSALKDQFGSHKIIKHIVLDDFLDERKARSLANEHKNIKEDLWLDYSHRNQKKTGITNKYLMGSNTRLLLEEISSQPFLDWLQKLTGAKNLIPDPDLDRAGLHRIKKGGYLNVHVDEESHIKYKYWKRRLNLLFYISPDYQENWGGNLEFWESKRKKIELGGSRTKRKIDSIEPIFNRCVIFLTDDKSYHGHPAPLNCPADSARRSIAAYYYQVLKIYK